MKIKSIIGGLMLLGVGRLAGADPAWFSLLGSDPVFQNSMRSLLKSQEKLVATLPDPTQYPAKDNWQPVADTCAGFVNIYKLSGDPQYAALAKQIADWLIASNDYLVANQDPSIPYLGWGPETRTGYYKCTDVGSYHADDAWDTAAAARCLLKYSEIDPNGANSPYFQRAAGILGAWPFVEHSSGDQNPNAPDLADDPSPFAAATMRWYMKSNEACENRYVKNTNIAMGEQYLRAYRLTGDPGWFQAGANALNSQLWDIVSHLNFGYDSYMIYDDQSDPSYADMVLHDERSTIRHTPDGGLICKSPTADSSCWNHLGFEAYDMYLVQQLTKDLDPGLFPVSGTQDALASAVGATMAAYRTSDYGDTSRFHFGDSTWDSPTHIVAYNCAQRFAADPSYLSECVAALSQVASGGTIFYSLVPDGMFTQN